MNKVDILYLCVISALPASEEPTIFDVCDGVRPKTTVKTHFTREQSVDIVDLVKDHLEKDCDCSYCIFTCMNNLYMIDGKLYTRKNSFEIEELTNSKI